MTELDIWLDPDWSGVYQGNFAWAGSPSASLVQYAATIFPTAPDAEPFHTGPHYFVTVDAAGDGALEVAGHRVEAAGWYTFRFVFSDVAGDVWVDFELDDRNGSNLAVIEGLEPTELLGPFKFPSAGHPPTAEYGSGHVWFYDVAGGLKLPIDEHRVRRGRGLRCGSGIMARRRLPPGFFSSAFGRHAQQPVKQPGQAVLQGIRFRLYHLP